MVSGQVNELGLDPSICGSVTHSPDQFRIPLSSVVERLAVNQEALIRYSDDRNVEGEPISKAGVGQLVDQQTFNLCE